MKFKNFTLDQFQEQAINAIENNESVVVSAPTGSGKTLIADYIIDKHKSDTKRIIYTAPIKALSNQKFRDFAKEYGDQAVGLMTGDMVINPTAKILIMTTEIYRNMVISNDEEVNDVAYVIFDEIHYINDIERGYVWEESIIYSPSKVRFLCLSATIPNADEFSRWIQAIKKHPVQTVVSTVRNVPLEHLFYDYDLGIASLDEINKDIQKQRQQQHRDRTRGKRREFIPEPNHLDLIKELGKDKLPCLFFNFSRHACQVKAKELSKLNLFPQNPIIIKTVRERLADTMPEISKLASTQLLKSTLPQGIAFHHAGLLPVIKVLVEELFGMGLINVLYTTETFAVGINMPAKTVCFDSLRKYDGINFRTLNTKEYFQIAGRAGRRGIDTVGFVVSMIFRPNFNYPELKRLTTADVEPIQSQFRLSVNTVLNLIDQHTPAEIEKILRLSFYSYQKFGEKYADVPTKLLLATYNSIIKRLRKYDFTTDEGLTSKGRFAAHVFADEITIGEIFATDVVEQLNDYQVLLVIACLVYEPRETHKFKKGVRNEDMNKLQKVLSARDSLYRERKFQSMLQMTNLVYPIYTGKSFFDILQETNLLEGDLIRFYGQILDRIGQIKKASQDYKLKTKIDNCQGIIQKALEGIYEV